MIYTYLTFVIDHPIPSPRLSSPFSPPRSREGLSLPIASQGPLGSPSTASTNADQALDLPSFHTLPLGFPRRSLASLPRCVTPARMCSRDAYQEGTLWEVCERPAARLDRCWNIVHMAGSDLTAGRRWLWASGLLDFCIAASYTRDCPPLLSSLLSLSPLVAFTSLPLALPCLALPRPASFFPSFFPSLIVLC